MQLRRIPAKAFLRKWRRRVWVLAVVVLAGVSMLCVPSRTGIPTGLEMLGLEAAMTSQFYVQHPHARLLDLCDSRFAMRPATRYQLRSYIDALRYNISRMREDTHVQLRRQLGCLFYAKEASIYCQHNKCRDEEGLINDAAIAYFNAYVRMAYSNKDLIYYHHLSKTGGTSVCQTAWLNGCRAPGAKAERGTSEGPSSPEGQIAADGSNCWSREFGDKFVWFERSNLRETLAGQQSFSCASRLVFARKYGFNFMANEGELVEDLAERPCQRGTLSVQTMREPVKRAISHLSHMVNDKYDINTEQGRACRLPESGHGPTSLLRDFNVSCYAEMQHVAASNYMTRMIIGGKAHLRGPKSISEKDRLLAEDIVSNFDVLLVPAVDNNVGDMMWRVGVGLPYKFSNPVRNQRTYDIPKESLDNIAAMNVHDIALYQFATQLFRIDAIVYLRASAACTDRRNATDVTKRPLATACDLLSIPAEPRPGHHVQWLKERRARGEAFACGCGWAGARETSEEVPHAMADAVFLEPKQNCPRGSLVSEMDKTA